jgi:hypothetical protein
MDEVVPKRKAKIKSSDCRNYPSTNVSFDELFLFSISLNFYMDISGKVMYITK